MFGSWNEYGENESCVPAWLVHDLGLDPSMRLDCRGTRWATRRMSQLRRFPVDASLRRVELFEGLSRRELRLVSMLSTPLRFPPTTTLAAQGATGKELFVVLDGEVEVRRDDDLIAVRGPGSHLGEIALLVDRPRTATLVTRTEVAARVVTRQELTQLMRAVPRVSERLHASMEARLVA